VLRRANRRFKIWDWWVFDLWLRDGAEAFLPVRLRRDEAAVAPTHSHRVGVINENLEAPERPLAFVMQRGIKKFAGW
jgi:hypothetical protein